VTNGGGLVSCAAEWYGTDPDEVPERVRRIYDTSVLILERASADGITTASAADRIAMERIARGRVT
jgi:glutamate dehydrogenase/leucine dehydrogenase